MQVPSATMQGAEGLLKRQRDTESGCSLDSGAGDSDIYARRGGRAQHDAAVRRFGQRRSATRRAAPSRQRWRRCKKHVAQDEQHEEAAYRDEQRSSDRRGSAAQRAAGASTAAAMSMSTWPRVSSEMRLPTLTTQEPRGDRRGGKTHRAAEASTAAAAVAMSTPLRASSATQLPTVMNRGAYT